MHWSLESRPKLFLVYFQNRELFAWLLTFYIFNEVLKLLALLFLRVSTHTVVVDVLCRRKVLHHIFMTHQ